MTGLSFCINIRLM